MGTRVSVLQSTHPPVLLLPKLTARGFKGLFPPVVQML